MEASRRSSIPTSPVKHNKVSDAHSVKISRRGSSETDKVPLRRSSGTRTSRLFRQREWSSSYLGRSHMIDSMRAVRVLGFGTMFCF